ncbi:hypothetical protein [Methylibium sp.]|uniref:hypothetical protein n=1 Tax=Methylibium sp. TaxID=2067992 RepID=UPI003D0FDB42
MSESDRSLRQEAEPAGHERAYLRVVAELQELARNAPHVTQDWVLQVASMDEMDMRRRLIRSSDWHGHFAHSLDGIPEIRNLPGAGIDGCRSHREVRAVVLGLLQRIERLNQSSTTASGSSRSAGSDEQGGS